MLQLSKITVVLWVVLALPSNLMGQCDVCQTDVRAACHSETTFSICLNGIPTEDFIECPTDFHCTGGKYICYPKATGVTNCITEEDGSTTPESTTIAPRDPDTLCKDTQKSGQYTNEMDPTCTTYVQCLSISGVWTGVANKCASGSWFNGQFCDSTLPDGCT